jgi:2-dehydropantoate 2-reductase
MKIAILGTGAMGSLFGARLGCAGHNISLIEVNIDQVNAINRDGLRLEHDQGTAILRTRAGCAAEFSGPVDLLIVFTKSYHTASALRDAAHLVDDQTAILSLQNGLGSADRIFATYGDSIILHGTTNWPADLKSPGRVSSHGDGEVRLWSIREADQERAQLIANVLNAAGLRAVADPSTNIKIWEKVLFNAVMNPVAALTRQTVGGMASHPDCADLAASILAEGFAVARLEGVAVEPARVQAAVEHAYANHRSHRPSMLHDILAGRATEIDSIVGELVTRSARHGLSTPVLETILRLVHIINGDGIEGIRRQ